MNQSDINIRVLLDEESIPEKIHWSATDKDDGAEEETKAFSLSIWDHLNQNTLRIDLWNKEMPIDEMKRFYIDNLGGLAQSILNSTGDEFMASAINRLCDKLVKHVEEELKNRPASE
ncbi:gliding motility-associated protein GldC [Roseivirga pacifica]|uniref:Gliding motility-associated protein GldC n=1 Tax=Roseivirga pacifica TaxID=1267423 RepID=A0A1I0QL90_9BACT|nr:gliding motility protein GldC [Roseivirga pacifica]MCO6360911.1 gliding motility protein GldC [Roseivirga pacifica]MCO6368800.1 gliding motility protein GldC [Roseivirga pacifica]MCO6372944.1 gliding motility protein GldC [Roseivirga pacifica]MCO6377004.1 gliding motility protein GldC [Roseivirga pacifica]MCO6377719.1 gliding motility protein GldC [Roseivirga pacifica]|tara:strand:+ start:468 stop:818 length:351 start_codon:yes stop_codon:yes gene_type:complete